MSKRKADANSAAQNQRIALRAFTDWRPKNESRPRRDAGPTGLDFAFRCRNAATRLTSSKCAAIVTTTVASVLWAVTAWNIPSVWCLYNRCGHDAQKGDHEFVRRSKRFYAFGVTCQD
jgi:hypothetical protein